MGPALALAKGSPRHEVLAKIAQRGPRAIEERPLSAELLALAGRTNGGLLTSDDLSSQRPEVHPASRHLLRALGETPSSRRAAKRSEGAGSDEEASSARFVIALPWANDESGTPVPPAGKVVSIATARAVCSVDRNGSFAIACWDEGIDGLTIGELGLRAPFFAEPVLRGETRVRPGDARPVAAPIALVGTDAGPEFAFASFGAGDAYDVLRGAVRSVIEEDRIVAHGDARLVALSHLAGTASIFRS